MPLNSSISMTKVSKEGAQYGVCYVGRLEGVSKSVQVLFHRTGAVMVLTLIFLKYEPCPMIN